MRQVEAARGRLGVVSAAAELPESERKPGVGRIAAADILGARLGGQAADVVRADERLDERLGKVLGHGLVALGRRRPPEPHHVLDSGAGEGMAKLPSLKALRSPGLTPLHEAGMAIETISKVTGHASTQVTMIVPDPSSRSSRPSSCGR